MALAGGSNFYKLRNKYRGILTNEEYRKTNRIMRKKQQYAQL